MSEKQAKQQRRQQRRNSHESSATSSGSGMPPSLLPATSATSDRNPLSSSLLAISLQIAVPLRVLACYERGGPTSEDLATAQRFGDMLAARGDRLLYRSEKEGETATLFNQLAESIAILAFVPGGIPSLFGQRFEAEAILAGFIGNEQAQAYCQHVRMPPNDGPTPDGQKEV